MFNATLQSRIDVTSELMIVAVKPDEPLSAYLPGQYVALGLPGSSPRPAHFPPEKEVLAPDKLIKRAYSIGSTPHRKDALEFYIAIVPDGDLTSRLALLKPGDRLFMANKITGTFTTESVEPSSNLVLVSTGTGIAPFIAMIRTPELWTPGRKITILHGVRNSKDLAYRQELLELTQTNPAFSYHAIVSRPDEHWSGARGYVQKFFEDGTLVLRPEIDHVFVCGNPAMIDAIETSLCASGYSVHSKKKPGNLHLEKYW